MASFDPNTLITDVKVFMLKAPKPRGNSKLLGFANITLGGHFVVKGFSIVSNDKGTWVNMKGEKGGDGKWYDSFFPITKEFRLILKDTILAKAGVGEEKVSLEVDPQADEAEEELPI